MSRGAGRASVGGVGLQAVRGRHVGARGRGGRRAVRRWRAGVALGRGHRGRRVVAGRRARREQQGGRGAASAAASAAGGSSVLLQPQGHAPPGAQRGDDPGQDSPSDGGEGRASRRPGRAGGGVLAAVRRGCRRRPRRSSRRWRCRTRRPVPVASRHGAVPVAAVVELADLLRAPSRSRPRAAARGRGRRGCRASLASSLRTTVSEAFQDVLEGGAGAAGDQRQALVGLGVEAGDPGLRGGHRGGVDAVLHGVDLVADADQARRRRRPG